jgi:hypothetical protein
MYIPADGDQGVKTECPKCGSGAARLRVEGPDLWLRCLCGVNKLLATTLAQSKVIEKLDAGAEVTMPRTGTKLWDALQVVRAYGPANSDVITDMVNMLRGDRQTVSEVSSQLTVLKHKALIEAMDSRKGLPGGSTWRISSRAAALLG